MKKADLKELEPMIMNIGDNSTEYNKHSMAQNKRMNTIDLTALSMIFTYNRKQDLHAKGIGFDDMWNNINAFKARYPQILVKGCVTSTMKNLSQNQAKEVLEANFNDMRTVARNYAYWTQELHKHLHNYSRAKITLSTRHMVNMEGVLDALDVYSDSQEEFDEWLDFITEGMQRYKNQDVEDGQVVLEVTEEKVN